MLIKYENLVSSVSLFVRLIGGFSNLGKDASFVSDFLFVCIKRSSATGLSWGRPHSKGFVSINDIL